MAQFQFTLPCRERPTIEAAAAQAAMFQFTLPCRERRISTQRAGVILVFQFTLPCRERLGAQGRRRAHAGVSIHAPV